MWMRLWSTTMMMQASLDVSRRRRMRPVHSKWRHGALARYGALGGALRERTINGKLMPSLLTPPRDIESSDGFRTMDLPFSVPVSITEIWRFPALVFCFF
jgi:hypothetical protein